MCELCSKVNFFKKLEEIDSGSLNFNTQKNFLSLNWMAKKWEKNCSPTKLLLTPPKRNKTKQIAHHRKA